MRAHRRLSRRVERHHAGVERPRAQHRQDFRGRAWQGESETQAKGQRPACVKSPTSADLGGCSAMPSKDLMNEPAWAWLSDRAKQRVTALRGKRAGTSRAAKSAAYVQELAAR